MSKLSRIMVVTGLLLLFLGITSVYQEVLGIVFQSRENEPLEPEQGFEPFLISVNQIAEYRPEIRPSSTPTPFGPGGNDGLTGERPGGNGPVITPLPSATPVPVYIPERLIIPDIGLDAPILPASYELIEIKGGIYRQWRAPDKFAAGWHTESATLGISGNMVLNGHHNIFDEVFGRLEELEVGDLIQVYSGNVHILYQVNNKMILAEKHQSLETRQANAAWLLPSDDTRLTLVTCWPRNNNTHRLIIVAAPITGILY